MLLRTKAVIFAIALSTLPVLGLGSVVYYFTSRNLVQSEIQTQESRATSMSDEVNHFLFERYGDIQVLAHLPMFNNPQATTGVTLQAKQDVLNKYIKFYRVYDSIAILDLQGKVLLQSSGTSVASDRKQDDLQQVIQTNRPVISPPQQLESTAEWAVHFTAPIKEVTSGKTIAVVRSRMPVKFLAAAVAELGMNGDEWHLVDNATGKIFAAQEQGDIGKKATTDFSILTQPEAVATHTVTPKGTSRTCDGCVNSVVAIAWIDKVQQLITYAPLTKLEGLPAQNWSIILARDTALAFTTPRKVLLILMLGTGATALFCSWLAVLLANRTSDSIKEVAEVIAASATEISATVEQQERTLAQQATAVQQTTTTMSQLNASSRQSAEQAESSAAGAQQSLALAEEGTLAVKKTLEGMSALNGKVEASAEQILHLGEQTQQIGSISDLVEAIAKQTNVLALNAAMEAARAGTEGRGFAVVAGEIRHLAEQSRTSAAKINALVQDIQSAINTTVMVTDEGTKTVVQEMQLAQSMTTTFTGVADATNNVFLNSQQISQSAKQQALAVQQIVSAMKAIDAGARETASGATQVRTSIEQLKLCAQQLQTLA